MGVNLWGFGLFFNQHFVVRSCRCILTSFSLKTWYNSTFYHHQSSSLWQTKQCEFPAEQRKIFQLQSAIFPQFTSSPYFPFTHLFPSIKKKIKSVLETQEAWKAHSAKPENQSGEETGDTCTEPSAATSHLSQHHTTGQRQGRELCIGSKPGNTLAWTTVSTLPLFCLLMIWFWKH